MGSLFVSLHLKDLVYADVVTTQTDLVAHLYAACTSVVTAFLDLVLSSIPWLVQACRDMHGSVSFKPFLDSETPIAILQYPPNCRNKVEGFVTAIWMRLSYHLVVTLPSSSTAGFPTRPVLLNLQLTLPYHCDDII
ncbi:hypothetical protein TNCV_2511041 [Trichonephila clavipes]|nr:hypothetical protein TNCV_2511041 [Trichonephila clavipes]